MSDCGCCACYDDDPYYYEEQIEKLKADVERKDDALKSILYDLEAILVDCDSPGSRQTLESQIDYIKAAIAPFVPKPTQYEIPEEVDSHEEQATEYYKRLATFTKELAQLRHICDARCVGELHHMFPAIDEKDLPEVVIPPEHFKAFMDPEDE